MKEQFLKARAVWPSRLENLYNQFVGFYTYLEMNRYARLTFCIAARSSYRLFIDGRLVAHGPARTAKGYCRIDRIEAQVQPAAHIAIEVAAYSKPVPYCNDCTLEPGMLTAEIMDEQGNVLSFTGSNDWRCVELNSRRSIVETMSHSRGILEWYDLDSSSTGWRLGKCAAFIVPALCIEPKYLKRRSPYPTYHKIPMQVFSRISDIIPDERYCPKPLDRLPELVNPSWYAMIPNENRLVQQLAQETEAAFSGKFIQEAGKIHITPCTRPAALTWQLDASEVGFIDIDITVAENCALDVLNSDHLNEKGLVSPNSYVARYCLKPGHYNLTTFEPKLVRYVKLILRTSGEALISPPCLIDYTYPDDSEAYFRCSDDDLNRIYNASRRTLRLNTLDIFMDCPERERGGWLCDSQFTAYGAWQQFGDTSVEKDFIENFMLTDADMLWHSFFPEVYPGTNRTENEVGIQNWSFWLLTELYDYARRSGDTEFIERCRRRVERFFDGVLSLRGESGLIEGLTSKFVDWSLSNKSYALDPISIPLNCLAVNMLEKAAALYNRADWAAVGSEMRIIIEQLDLGNSLLGGNGDAAVYENGKLARTGCQTESGIALELWSGFHDGNADYVRKFIERMGPAPLKHPDPNIAPANLFIGLMIRFDVLARMGRAEQLVREWKALYLPQLQMGSTTLFETVDETSGCHGFNGAIGALMTNVVLGLGHPDQSTKTVKISPHLCGLTWASGSAAVHEGTIFVHWSADYESRVLELQLELPKGWRAEIELPPELSIWKIVQ